MNKRTACAVAAAFITGGVLGAFALLGAPAYLAKQTELPQHPVWNEIAWPFPIDEWGKGKAFRCNAADCGAEVNLFIRAKIGFCNCATGVSDDAELDRLSDFKLMGDKPAVLGPGRPIDVAWMKGRIRPYAVAAPYRASQSALAVAFNDHCDAIVATVVVGHGQPAALEPGVIEFLNGKTILHWAEVTLGL